MKKQLRDLESKDLWIQARVDELMDDDGFLEEWARSFINITVYAAAVQKATREHAEIESMILDAQIDNLELG